MDVNISTLIKISKLFLKLINSTDNNNYIIENYLLSTQQLNNFSTDSKNANIIFKLI